MTRLFEINAIALSLGFALTHGAAAVRADDAPVTKTLKPLSALSFKIGEKRGVGYFVNNANQCKLVLTFAEEPNWDRPQSFSVTRHEENVPAGASTRYNPTEGKALEFACRGDASAMSVREIERVVAK